MKPELAEVNLEPLPELPKPRFHKASEEEVSKLEDSRHEDTTKAQTKWVVNIVREWCAETLQMTMDEVISSDEFPDYLRRFYASVRQKNGDSYSKSALISIRAGLQRYLDNSGVNSMNLRGEKFSAANRVLQGLIKELKREGKDTAVHKDIIDEHDMSLLKNYFTNLDNPCILQQKVFFDIMFHFGRRGREGLHSLTKNSFKLVTASNGIQMVEMTYNEATKTDHGLKNVESKRPVMSQTDNIDCPVKSFKEYLLHLHPECPSFFQTPKKQGCSGPWYANLQVGINTLGNLMKKISHDANLSKTYTNHCIRATCASVLSKSFSDREICHVTGHKNTESLKPYINHVSQEKKQHYSSALSSYGTGTGKENLSNERPTKISKFSNTTSLEVQQSATSGVLQGALFNGSVNININIRN